MTETSPWTADLIPTPVRQRVLAGTWTMGEKTRVFPAQGASGRDRKTIEGLVESFRKHLGAGLRMADECHPARGHVLWVGEEPAAARQTMEVPEKAEGYALNVSGEGILLAGSEEAGLANAVRTLDQMLCFRPRRDRSLPSVEIYDEPAMSWRGVMVDVARQVERPDYLEAMICDLASFKKNLFMLYFENKFRWQSRPELAHPLGYTHEDFHRFADLARDNHMEFVPALASLGHCEGFLSHPSLAPLREEGAVYQLSLRNPETRKLLGELYSELLPLYPGRFFHVNCDESPLLSGPPGSPPQYLEESLRCFRDLLLFLYELLGKHGKKLLVWGDMLIHYPQLMEGLPRDIIIVDWDYGSMRRRRREAPRMFRDAGFDVWVAPAAGRSAEVALPPLMQLSDNVPRFIRAGRRAGADGELTTIWEMFTTNPLVMRPGLIASAQSGWAPDAIDPDVLPDRVAEHLYGAEARGEVVRAWRRLSGTAFSRRYSESEGREVPGYRTYHIDSHEIVPTDPMLYLTYDRSGWAESLSRDAGAGLEHLEKAIAAAGRNRAELEDYKTGGLLQFYQGALREKVNGAGLEVVEAERLRRAGDTQAAGGRLAGAAAGLEELAALAGTLAKKVPAVWGKTRYPHDPALRDIHLRRLEWAQSSLHGHIDRLRRAQRDLAKGRDVSLARIIGGQPVLFYDANNPSRELVDIWQQRIEGSDDGTTWHTLMTKGWFMLRKQSFAMLQALENGWLPRRIRLKTVRLHVGPSRAPLQDRLAIRVARTLTPAEMIEGPPDADFRTCDVRVCFCSDVGYRLAKHEGLMLEYERTEAAPDA